MKQRMAERWGRRKFLVPNAVTVANMFCGFLAIIYAATDRFQQGAYAIGISILLDGLDGRVARRLNATSKFGFEMDSFSDLISFGFAPALLMYHWAFQPMADEFGVVICFLYATCTAGRLARFNVTDPGIKNFQGMPTPGAAGAVAAIVHTAPHVDPSWTFVLLGSVVMPALSYLMVSQIEFFSVKRIKIGEVTKGMIAFLATMIALIWYKSQVGFMILAIIYASSGPIGVYLKRRNLEKSAAERSSSKDPEPTPSLH